MSKRKTQTETFGFVAWGKPDLICTSRKGMKKKREKSGRKTIKMEVMSAGKCGR